MNANSTDRNSLATHWLIGILLLAMTAIAFGQVVGFDFVNFDDDVHVYQNPHIIGGWTWDNFVWDFGIHGPSQWHPLAWMAHQWDWEFYGEWAGGHHLTNLLFHAANAILLYLFLARVTGFLWRSGFIAAVFAVHPLNVESVAWVSERRNVLAMFFGLLTLLAYSSYVRKRSWGWYFIVLALFGLALMSKPLMVTLPCVMLLLDYWPFHRWNWGQTTEGLHRENAIVPVSLGKLVLEKIPLLMLSLGASVLTILCQQADGILASQEALPFYIRLLNALAAYSLYLRKLVWPSDLAVFYPHPGFVSADAESQLFIPALVGGAILLLVTTGVLFTVRKRRYLAVGWFWFLGTLIPMIGLIQSGQQQLADRYMYLPLIGILWAGTWGIAEAAAKRRFHPSWLRLIGGASILGCLVASAIQTRYWKNSITLFEHALEVTENNSWAHNNLGLALSQNQKPGQAVGHFVEAIQIDPDYGLAYYNLGVVLHDQGNITQAIPQYQEALRLMPTDVESHLRMGVALAELGQIRSAIPYFREAVRLAPHNPDTHLNLALAEAKQGHLQEARSGFLRVLEIAPNQVKANFGLALVLVELNEPNAAESRFRQTLALAPDLAQAHLELGKLYLKQDQKQKAIHQLQEALRLQPQWTEAKTQLDLALEIQ